MDTRSHTAVAQPSAEASSPYERGSLDLVIEIHAEMIPPGVTAWHIRELVAAYIEDRAPHLHEDIYDAMPGIRARVLGHEPGPMPPRHACAKCGGTGAAFGVIEEACPACGGSGRGKA